MINGVDHFFVCFYLVSKYFHHSKENPVPIKQSLPILPSPWPLEATNPIFVSMGLPILGIAYKWNHALCDLLCLASVT